MGHLRAAEVVAIFFSALLVLGCVNPKSTETATASDIQAFLQTEAARKLDPALQSRLLNLEQTNRLDETLTVVLGLKSPLSESEREQLQRAEVTIRSTMGTVVTALVPAKRVPQVASLGFVARIELPVSVTPKGERDAP